MNHTFHLTSKNFADKFTIRDKFNYAILKYVMVVPKADSGLKMINIRTNLIDGRVNNYDSNSKNNTNTGIIIPKMNDIVHFDIEKEHEVKKLSLTEFKFYTLDGTQIDFNRDLESVTIHVEYDFADDDDED